MQYIDKWGFEWLVARVSPQGMAVFTVFVLAIWLVLRVNKIISDKQNADEEIKDSVKLLTKQAHKTQQLLSCCPCVSKNNATWLQDPERNGGAPPEYVKCQFQEANKK